MRTWDYYIKRNGFVNYRFVNTANFVFYGHLAINYEKL